MNARFALLVLPLFLVAPTRLQAQCSQAVQTRIIPVFNPRNLAPQTGTTSGAINVTGCRFINIFVQYRDSASPNPQPGPIPSVSLGAQFQLDNRSDMRSRMYVNLESNLTSLQNVNFIVVAPTGPFTSTLGTQILRESGNYIVRIPVMGPFVVISPFNDATVTRQVWVKIYAQY